MTKLPLTKAAHYLHKDGRLFRFTHIKSVPSSEKSQSSILFNCGVFYHKGRINTCEVTNYYVWKSLIKINVAQIEPDIYQQIKAA